MVNVSDLADKVAAALTGTCRSMTDALEECGAEGMDEDLAFCEALDDQVFCCTDCSWWCEISEECSDEVGADELICADCAGENY